MVMKNKRDDAIANLITALLLFGAASFLMFLAIAPIANIFRPDRDGEISGYALIGGLFIFLGLGCIWMAVDKLRGR
jgi:hypothetical protein